MSGQPTLEFGWYLPTNGDTTAFNLPDAGIEPSMEMFERVLEAAEGAGFEYLLIPVIPSCWEAYVSGAYFVGQTRRIKPLIAAKPGYINPVMMARMIATFDQVSRGRLCINLIAGMNEDELRRDGLRYSKTDRYALMDEEVSLMKALWTAEAPIDHNGRFHQLEGASVLPKPYQSPYPKIYLGGGSAQAWELSAKHSDVHLFWGDTPEQIADNVLEIRRLAAAHGRGEHIQFGMRLQVVCRDTEDEAWSAARELVAHGTDADRAQIQSANRTSEANKRVQALAEDHGELIGPHLWTGITQVRAGAGIAVVGNPRQCADALLRFVEAGCSSFCLSGFPHDTEAERFGRLVMPLLK
ncbi:MAG: LLM class flavin-dependent oxidoreductase [Gammaproteobacteria bacterium]|nr:LLM class flavin-dependent oxidoreductase [Gammaproteobacteria bacterium]